MNVCFYHLIGLCPPSSCSLAPQITNQSSLSTISHNARYILENFINPKDSVTIISSYRSVPLYLMDSQKWSGVDFPNLKNRILKLTGVERGRGRGRRRGRGR